MPFFFCLLVKIAKIKPREIKYQEGTRSPGARETCMGLRLVLC